MSAVLRRHRAIVLAYAAMLVLLFATTLVSPGFLSPSNLRSVVVLAAFVGIVALGQTFVIVGGGIDLSVPWVLNTAAILLTLLADGRDGALLWAMPAMLAFGAVVGAVNGCGVALLNVPPIIMTLAVNVILQGLVLVSTGGSPTPATPAAIKVLAVGRIGPVPVIALVWAALAVAATLALSKSAFGRQLYAVGSNGAVAFYSGVPTARTKILSYVISGMAAALGGMLLTGYSGQAYLGMGDPYLFTSVAAVAIGGASILGGSGHYIGTVAGAFILTILAGLLPALNLPSGALLVVYGGVILVTVAMASEIWGDLVRNLWAGRRRERRNG